MAALFQAADVMLVTPGNGMNLVAKEYVACRHDGDGALVLSEFTGAYHELKPAYVCNPHDIEGTKRVITKAITDPKRERQTHEVPAQGRRGKGRADVGDQLPGRPRPHPHRPEEGEDA